MSRRVCLVLCSPAGAVLGELPAYDVASPWWPDVEPVVTGARELFGVEVSVLRLLEAAGEVVSYLAETAGLAEVALAPSAVVIDEQPLRASWARPGGVAELARWAAQALDAAGHGAVVSVEQVKSWNLSLVLRLRLASGATAWCKATPPFLAHEGAVLELVAAYDRGLVPPLIATAPGRVLLGDVPGVDLFGAGEPTLTEMVRRLVALQQAFVGRTGELLGAGLPDWRSTALPGLLSALLDRAETRAGLRVDEQRGLARLVGALPDRLVALAGCGLPDTLVHGDFHAGNWRSDGRSLVLLDWGDAGVGHPLLDLPAFFRSAVDPAVRARVQKVWLAHWRRAVPGSDPDRAAELIAPVAALRQALTYRTFLDGIEPTERVYHASDVSDWLRRALTLG